MELPFPSVSPTSQLAKPFTATGPATDTDTTSSASAPASPRAPDSAPTKVAAPPTQPLIGQAEGDRPPPEGCRVIFRSSYWHWGLRRRLHAHAYGLTAFRLVVRIGGPRRMPPDRAAAGARARRSATPPRRPAPRTPRRRKKQSPPQQ